MGGKTYVANCRTADGSGVTTAHVSMSCRGALGVGYHQRWQITRDGDQSGAISPTDQYTSYVSPTIIYVGVKNNGCGKNCMTGGGQEIEIAMANVGSLVTPTPAVAYVEYSSVGTNGQVHTYGPIACVQKTAPYTRQLCTTVPGVGRNWIWKLTVGNQSSQIFRKNGDSSNEYNNGYAAPTITKMSLSSSSANPPELSYGGGQLITIEGTNFGPIATSVNPNMVTASCSSDGGATSIKATACVVTVANTKMVCNSAKISTEVSVATNGIFLWTVVVGGSESTACSSGDTFCQVKYVPQWTASPATGCATTCGVVGTSGSPGSVVCQSGVEDQCSAPKPAANVCPATASCGQWNASPATGCPTRCGYNLQRTEGVDGTVLCDTGTNGCDVTKKPQAQVCKVTVPCALWDKLPPTGCARTCCVTFVSGVVHPPKDGIDPELNSKCRGKPAGTCQRKCGGTVPEGVDPDPGGVDGAVVCSTGNEDDCDAAEKGKIAPLVCKDTKSNCGPWMVSAQATGCSTACGLAEGASGIPGVSVCTSLIDYIPDIYCEHVANPKPAANVCPATASCGEWNAAQATECSSACGFAEGAHGTPGIVVRSSPMTVLFIVFCFYFFSDCFLLTFNLAGV